MQINLLYKTNIRIIAPKKLKNYIKKIIKVLFKTYESQKFQFNFVFLNNKEIKKINTLYLKHKYPTDVLCFKYDKHSADFLISLQQVLKNAKIFNNTSKKELLLVIIHGLLHFKGMQDKNKTERETMNALALKTLLKIFKEKR